MSAIAHIFPELGYDVSGSDRYFKPAEKNDIKENWKQKVYNVFYKDGSGITASTELVVVSAAIEDTVFWKYRKQSDLNIPIIKRLCITGINSSE
jgi:UDP-N-acetylmuramate-alanine ligase